MCVLSFTSISSSLEEESRRETENVGESETHGAAQDSVKNRRKSAHGNSNGRRVRQTGEGTEKVANSCSHVRHCDLIPFFSQGNRDGETERDEFALGRFPGVGSST